MLKHSLAALAISLSLPLLCTPSFALNSTEGIVVYSPLSGVTVITVSTDVEADEDLANGAPRVIVENNVVVVISAPSRRLIDLHRAFGQRYLGSKKVYSGPRYPF